MWVGIIALAGLAAQTGTVMIIYLDEAFHAYQRAGRMKTQHDLFEAITYGAVQRVRPKLMTVCMITFGLVPALWAARCGRGSDSTHRRADDWRLDHVHDSHAGNRAGDLFALARTAGANGSKARGRRARSGAS